MYYATLHNATMEQNEECLHFTIAVESSPPLRGTLNSYLQKKNIVLTKEISLYNNIHSPKCNTIKSSDS